MGAHRVHTQPLAVRCPASGKVRYPALAAALRGGRARVWQLPPGEGPVPAVGP